ncbi:unnamed protein product [Staurois parvus]|uniref:Uncharacterized protein n=1 Tax=Staurois parvus TaxID=386267 RepID=A0ABN9DV44_9NEOB|nr:unnamed protein product [Staurois parvus]
MIPYCPGGPMSCQSAPGTESYHSNFHGDILDSSLLWPGVSRGPHEIPLVPFS